MATIYGSFLVRVWRVADAALRVEVEHIQSGRRTRVATLAEATSWIDREAGSDSLQSPADGPPPP